MVSLPGLVWASSQHGSWVPRTKCPKRARGEAASPFASEVSEHHLCCGLNTTTRGRNADITSGWEKSQSYHEKSA